MHRRSFLQGALAAPLAGAFAASPARAQAWPTRNITMIVAFPPGGQADLAARPVAAALEKILGRSVVVDNRSGAGGMLGNAAAARAEPDGHTLIMALSSMTFLPEAERLYDRKPSYEYDQLVPIARRACCACAATRPTRRWPIWWRTPGSGRARSRSARPATTAPATCRSRCSSRRRASSCCTCPIAAAGRRSALTAFLGKQVDITTQAPGPITPHVQSGAARLLANWGPRRSAEYPAVPTFIELGYKDVEYYIWAGLFTPKGTPQAVIARLRDAMREVMKNPQVTDVFVKAASPPAYMDQPEFQKFVDDDARRLIPVIRKIGRLDEK
jgi:tripartite-type tricarboxylate transporter receptor subunit TctC